MSSLSRIPRSIGTALVITLAAAWGIVVLAHPANAAPPVYVVAGDDPNATGDQWGLHEAYYSELRAAITDPASFGSSGTVNAMFTIGTPRAIPLTTNSLNGVDVYFVSARDILPAEVPVLQAFVQHGGALVVNSNAPGFFDDTAWLGFGLSPRVVYGDGAAPYTTTHRAPSPSTVVSGQAANTVVNGPFGAVSTFENWHTVAGFATVPASATVLARTTLTGPDNNGSANFITISNVATLATIPADALGSGSGPVLATSDVDTFSNAYTVGIGFATDTLCTLTGTTNGRLARNAFAWIAAQKALINPPTTTSTTTTSTTTTTTRPAATLSATPASVAAGVSLSATWSGIATPSATDWIGLYATNATADTTFLAWRYTTGTAAGTAPFTIPFGAAPGSTYELRLFTNNGYTRLAVSNAFRVTTGVAPTLAATPATLNPNTALAVSWSGIPSPTATDWIGLYTTGVAGETSFLAWRYTTGTAAGTAPFTIPSTAAAGTTYELRLFTNNSYTRLAKSNPIAVQSASLGASPATVARGATTTAAWASVANPSATDWIGLYATGAAGETSFVTWRYTTGTTSGSVPFAIPTTAAPGITYELRLFTNDTYNRLATSAAIAVS